MIIFELDRFYQSGWQLRKSRKPVGSIFLLLIFLFILIFICFDSNNISMYKNLIIILILKLKDQKWLVMNEVNDNVELNECNEWNSKLSSLILKLMYKILILKLMYKILILLGIWTKRFFLFKYLIINNIYEEKRTF